MSNKLMTSRTADMPEQIVITKDTCFENGIIGERVLAKEVVKKLNKIENLQQDNNDLMNRVKELEEKLNEKL